MENSIIINESIDIMKSLREDIKGAYILPDRKADVEIAIITATGKIMQAKILAEKLDKIADNLRLIG